MTWKTRLPTGWIFVFVLAFAVGGCANQPMTTAQDYPALAARAEHEIRRADKEGFLWLHTESHLEQSRKAYEAGDVAKARALAQKALEESLLAQRQAAASKTQKPDFTYRR